VDAMIGRQRIVRRDDRAAKLADEFRDKIPVIFRKAVDVTAAVQIIDAFFARLFPGRDRPDRPAVDLARRDAVSFAHFRRRPIVERFWLAAFHPLADAPDLFLPARQSEDDFDNFAL
jgi:hypothetical protein